MPPIKRKAPSRYEGESPVKRVKSTDSTPTPTKRTITPRAAKVNRNDPEWLVTNEKSPLAHDDLHAELCDPKTYEGFTIEDWSDLAATLPQDIPRNNDGSIPLDFFKYNPDFRRGIREFQEDLATGRLEPAWQAAAAEAMEKRAQGKFNSHKEKEFEEFWGQKQKLDYKALAGESAKLKLNVMIQNGVFKEGDIISYCRVVGTSEAKTIFEKDCKILTIGSNTLTLAIPPGQLKYARDVAEPEAQIDPDVEEDNTARVPNGTKQPNDGTETEEKGITVEHEDPEGDIPAGEIESNLKEEQIGENFRPKGEGSSRTVQGKGTSTNSDIEDETTPNLAAEARPAQEGVILREIKTLQQLENKVLEIDGRLKDQKVRGVNAWRFCRCKRNNQDLGTLFEMRENFYVYKYPQIVKGSRDKRARNRDDWILDA